MAKIFTFITVSIFFALFIACEDTSSTQPEISSEVDSDLSSSSAIAFSSSGITSESLQDSAASSSSQVMIASSSSTARNDSLSSSSSVIASSSSVIANEETQSSSSEFASSSSTTRNNSSSSSSWQALSSSSEYIDITAGSIYNASADSLIDLRDGSVYKTVTIGNQIWMAENLNFKYNYNTAISMCYDNYAKNCVRYGRLYTWSAAMDSAGVFSQNALGCGRNAECSASGKVRGVCPEGWHLPDSTEILALLKYMECEKDETLANAYDHCSSRLKSTSGWNGGEGTDDYGFTALAAGIYISSLYEFDFQGYQTAFWSSSRLSGGAYKFSLLSENATEKDCVYIVISNMYQGNSVRCLKD